MQGFALAIAAALAATHVLASHLTLLRRLPRSRLLSAAGGVSVAYVFVHLLPELAAHQAHLDEHWRWLDHHIYLLALVGFAAFYGLERFARASRQQRQGDKVTHDTSDAPPTPPAVFWIHIGSFTIYNALIGYLLLHREEKTWSSLVWFGVAMGLHFLVNDHGLHDHHQHRYNRYGRWVLAAAVLVGWAAGVGIDVGQTAVAVLLALIGGAVILNVIKEELPEERASRWWAFAAGAAAYSALLLAI